MTENEHKDWLTKQTWLTPEQAATWTPAVREAWLRMRKAYKAWQLTGTAPAQMLGCVKAEGALTPLFIPNEEYLHYEKMKAEWDFKFQPKYITENRARMSNGDFGEQDDWTKEAA